MKHEYDGMNPEFFSKYILLSWPFVIMHLMRPRREILYPFSDGVLCDGLFGSNKLLIVCLAGSSYSLTVKKFLIFSAEHLTTNELESPILTSGIFLNSVSIYSFDPMK